MTIYEQISAYCDCIDKISEGDIDELIDLVSMYTCWTSKPCETFLMGSRKEVVTLPNCLKECGIYTFTPFYRPFVEDSFTFTLVEQNGLTETATAITDYIYSSADEAFRIDLGLPDCKCHPKCGCESTYKLVVTYEAGYEEIPDCLLPVLCEALTWVKDKNTCDCECEPCEKDTTTGVIDESTLEGNIQAFMLEMLTNQYKRQLSLISLCNTNSSLWGFVV